MGQQEVDAEEKARLKQEKWNRRKAELIEELKLSAVEPVKNVKTSGKASSYGLVGTRQKKPQKNEKHVEPDTDSEDFGGSEAECDDSEDCIRLF